MSFALPHLSSLSSLSSAPLLSSLLSSLNILSSSSSREGLTKVRDEVKDRLIDPLSSKAESLVGMKSSKPRHSYSLDVEEGSENGKPTRNLATVWTGKEKVEMKDIGQLKRAEEGGGAAAGDMRKI